MRFLLPFVFILLVMPQTVFPSWQLPLRLTKISDKNLPDEFQGCGEAYYFTASDRKVQKKAICLLDDVNALISVNNTRILLKPNKRSDGYEAQGYMLIIKDGPTKKLDDEYFQMKATFTLKFRGKIVWTGEVFGDGGC